MSVDRIAFSDHITDDYQAAFRLAFALLHDAGEAEDAVQDAAFKAWRKIHQFQVGKPFRPWLLGIVANECRSRVRGRWWAVIRSGEIRQASADSPADEIASLELRDALNRLRYADRLILILRFLRPPSLRGDSSTARRVAEGGSNPDRTRLEEAAADAPHARGDRMIDETEIFERFHSAFHEQPSPGAAQRLRAVLLEQSVTARPAAAPKRGVGVSVRFVAGLALIAIAIASTGVFVALHRPAIRPAPAQPPFSHAVARSTWGMVSPTVGWQQTSWFDPYGVHHILRTTDAGAHWTDVTPPESLLGVTENVVTDFGPDPYILDATHVWITDLGVRTADGGRTWQRIATVPSPLGNPPVYFLDANHGWLVSQNALYRTLDGGLSWKQIPAAVTDQPACTWGQAAFASLNHGWLSVACPGRGFGAETQLLVTHDGGATWSPQPLPLGAASGTPVVFDATNAMILISPDTSSGPAVLVTSDVGETWTVQALPGLDVYFLDARHGWVFDGTKSLYRTTDGGLTWSLVRASLPFSWSADARPPYFRFFDSLHGFAEETNCESCAGFTTIYLLKTTDGGKTWSVVGPMPPRGY